MERCLVELGVRRRKPPAVSQGFVLCRAEDRKCTFSGRAVSDELRLEHDGLRNLAGSPVDNFRCLDSQYGIYWSAQDVLESVRT